MSARTHTVSHTRQQAELADAIRNKTGVEAANIIRNVRADPEADVSKIATSNISSKKQSAYVYVYIKPKILQNNCLYTRYMEAD